MPAAQVEPVRGDVFGLPTLDLGGGRARARPHDDAPPPVPPADAFAQHAREAARTQIAFALQQRLGMLPPADADGRCEPSDGDAALACDSDALAQVLQSEAAALAGLLKAFRGVDPRITVAAVTHAQGRYALELR